MQIEVSAAAAAAAEDGREPSGSETTANPFPFHSAKAMHLECHRRFILNDKRRIQHGPGQPRARRSAHLHNACLRMSARRGEDAVGADCMMQHLRVSRGSSEIRNSLRRANDL